MAVRHGCANAAAVTRRSWTAKLLRGRKAVSCGCRRAFTARKKFRYANLGSEGMSRPNESIEDVEVNW